MNTRKVTFLAAFFIFLVLALWYQKIAQSPEDLITVDSLHRFVPDDLDLQTIDALELTRPGSPDIRLEKKNNQWQLPQWGGLPANQQNVERLLEVIGNLRGELRSSDSEVVADYELDQGEALSLALLSNATEQLRLFLGKGDFRTLFLRVSNSTEVYAAPGMILGYLGIQGKILSEQFWVETTLVSLNVKDIQELHLIMPENEATLKRIEPDQDAGDKAADQDNWEFAQIRGKGLTQEHLEAILIVLDRVSVFEALPVDSPEREELNQPSHVLEIITKSKTLTLEAVQGTSAKLIREKGSVHIYKIHDTIFERLFPLLNQESMD